MARAEIRIASGATVDDFGLPRRTAPRPPELRQPGYDEAFDDTTLWYDAFKTPAGEVAFVAPPLRNLAAFPWIVRDGERPTPTRDVASSFDVLRRTAPAAGPITVEIGGRRVEVDPGPSGVERFAGRRVLYTKSRDNEPDWIEDWARWHVRKHGVDAILLYDNGSTNLSPKELAELLLRTGAGRVTVERWPFKFGPPGRNPAPGSPLPPLPWDSLYCERAMLTHARHRYLLGAAGVLSLDVDELLSASKGKIFDLLEASGAPALHFKGSWAFCPQGVTRPRHADHTLAIDGLKACPAKWAAVPARVPDGVPFGIHRVGTSAQGAPVSFRHFWSISTSWQTDRSPRNHPPGALVPDPRLASLPAAMAALTRD